MLVHPPDHWLLSPDDDVNGIKVFICWYHWLLSPDDDVNGIEVFICWYTHQTIGYCRLTMMLMTLRYLYVGTPTRPLATVA